MVGGYERNCCKECSDVEGWYHNKKYENASAEEKQRIADVRDAEIARKEDAEAASAAMARAFSQLMRVHRRALQRQRELLKQS